MKHMAGWIAAAVLAACAGGPALAQTQTQPGPSGSSQPFMLSDADLNEIYCIYDNWSDAQVGLVVDNFFDPRTDEAKDVDAAYDGPGKACAAKYGWEPDEQAILEDVALYTAIIDVAAAEMQAEGLRDPSVVGAVYDQLPAADRDRFLSAGWETDETFLSGLKAKLSQAGLPSTDLMMGLGVATLAACAQADAAILDWEFY